MSKDPAVLFYTSDFISGTMTMTDEQVGKYIRLLCLQHQKGKLSEKDMMFICKSYDIDIFEKFPKGEDGFYRNARMSDEAQKRIAYSASRKANREKGFIISKSYDEHMENENENEDINTSKDTTKKKKPEKQSYAEFVTMTEPEYEKLVAELTEIRTKKAIEILNNYKGSRGKKYKSDYLAIHSWVIKRLEDDEEKEKHGSTRSGSGQTYKPAKGTQAARLAYDPSSPEAIAKLKNLQATLEQRDRERNQRP